MQCKHCVDFFKRFSCAKTKPGYDGECDCPKCQGYCECTSDPDIKELIADLESEVLDPMFHIYKANEAMEKLDEASGKTQLDFDTTERIAQLREMFKKAVEANE